MAAVSSRLSRTAAVALLVTGIVGCGGVKLQSLWLDRDITIDGVIREWDGALNHVEDAGLSIGVRNDDTHVYLALHSDGPHLAEKIVRSAFTVWFDPKGGEERVLGIRFPVSPPNDGRSPFRVLTENERRERIKQIPKGLEVLGPDPDDHIEFDRDEIEGLEVAVNLDGSSGGYELKIPIFSGERYRYGINPRGSKFSVGLESSGPSGPGVPGDRGGRGGRGERGGRGGDDFGGGRGGGRGEIGSRGPGNLWATIELAEEPVDPGAGTTGAELTWTAGSRDYLHRRDPSDR